MKCSKKTLTLSLVDRLLQALILLWFPLSFWLKWTTGPATSLYDGTLNAEFTSLIILWLAWVAVFARMLLTESPTVKFTPLQSILGVLVGLFFLWSLASVNWSVSGPASFNHASLWLQYALFALFCAYCSGLFQRSFFSKVFAFWSLTLSLPILWLYYFNGFHVPYLGLGYNRSIAGEALGTLVPVLLALSWLTRRKSSRVNLYAVAALLGYIGVLIMGQRAPLYALWAGLMGLGIAALFYSVRSKYSGRKIIPRFIITSYVWIFIFSALYLIPSPLTGNLENWDTARRVYNVSQTAEVGKFRILGLAMGSLQLAEKPLTGYGAGTFPLMNFSTREKLMENSRWHHLSDTAADSIFNRAHCEPAQVAGELGIPGLLLWSALFAVLPLFLLWKTLSVPLPRKIIILSLVASTGVLGISSLASSFGPRTILCMLPWLAVIASNRLCLPKFSPLYLPKTGFIITISLLLLMNIPATLHKIGDLKSCFYADLAERRLEMKPVPSFQEIATLYEQSIEAAPHLPSAYSSTALLLARHGKLPEALEYIQTAYDLGFQSLYNLFLQSYSLWLSGKKEEAVDVTRLMTRVGPKDEFALLHNRIFSETLRGHSSEASPFKSETNHAVMINLTQSILKRQKINLSTPDLLSGGRVAYWQMYLIYPSIEESPAKERQALYLRQFHK